jgi:hypothetical protein
VPDVDADRVETAMDLWMLVLGLTVLAVTAYDALATVVAPWAGGGPITSRLTRMWWRSAHRLARSARSVVLVTAGPAVLTATIVIWLLLVWVGWTLVFASDPSAVVRDADGNPADLAGRAYFAGFTTFTLGVGDLTPAGAPWQLLTVVASASGLALTTAAITYLTPVLSAVVERRKQAATIAGFGGTPQDLVRRMHHDGSLRLLEPVLVQLADDLGLTAERHLAYPVLHAFHPRHPRQDLRVQLATLDDALTLVVHGLDAGRVEMPHPAVIASARSAIDQVVDRGALLGRAAAPRALGLADLGEADIPTVDPVVFERRVTTDAERRRLVAAYAAESPWWRDASGR